MVLGADLFFSVIGGLMGAVILMTSAPVLAEFALTFTTFEYFWLAAMGWHHGHGSAGSQVKGPLHVSGPVSVSASRHTLDPGLRSSVEMLNVGFHSSHDLSGVSEVIRSAEVSLLTDYPCPQDISRDVGLSKYRSISMFRNDGNSSISCTGDIAAWVAYAASKRFSKEPEKYGKDHQLVTRGQPIIPVWQELINPCLWDPELDYSHRHGVLF
jgi:hypothetical protein